MRLKQREKDVISMYFGIDRDYALTLNEIGEIEKLLALKLCFVLIFVFKHPRSSPLHPRPAKTNL